MLDDGSAALNTLLLFEITTDDQTQREQQAGGQQAAGGELGRFCIKNKHYIPPPFPLPLTSLPRTPRLLHSRYKLT